MIDPHMMFRLAATAHPDEVFLYSVRHDYLVLADQAAVFTLKNPTAGFFGRIRAAGCQDDIVIRWVCCPFFQKKMSCDAHCRSFVIAIVGWKSYFSYKHINRTLMIALGGTSSRLRSSGKSALTQVVWSKFLPSLTNMLRQ